MGRPTKLTPEVTKTITDAIAIGATYQAAAEYAGVGYSTFLAWMVKKAKNYVAFQEAVTGANAKARISLLAAIQKPAREGDWRAAAWILERRFGDEYGPVVKFGKMADDELRTYIASRVEKLSAGDSGSGAAGLVPAEAEEE